MQGVFEAERHCCLSRRQYETAQNAKKGDDRN
jgi:hypothetical protein